MRVFLDTNVLVSAFTTRGLCTDLFRAVIAEHELVLGEVVLEELRRVLTKRFRMPPGEVDALESYLRTFEIVGRPKTRDPIRVRDEADGWVLASAHAATADVLVTGDADLHAVAKQARARILTPREFWGELRRPNAV